VNLQRQTSEDLQAMLAKALSAMDEQKPVHRSNSASPLPRVGTMLAILNKLKGTANLASMILRNQLIHQKIASWRLNARQAVLPSLLHNMAQSAFDAADTSIKGKLSPAQADTAAQALLDEVAARGLTCDQICQSHGDFEKFVSDVDFEGFVTKLHQLPFPAELATAVRVASTGTRCPCGAFMVEKRRRDCYPGGAVRCDFTGQSVEADTVWHCDRNRAAPVHPFGFDVAGEATDEYKQYNQTARLYSRLEAAIVDASTAQPELSGEEESDELLAKLHTATQRKALQVLHQRKAECASALLPNVEQVHSSISADLENATAMKLPTAELEARKQFCHDILATEDWAARKHDAWVALQQQVDNLQGFSETLSHDKLRFRDEAHRTEMIAEFQKAFDPAGRHASFERMCQKLQHVCGLARDFLVLERFDEQDPDTQQLLESIGGQVLQALMQQRGVMFIPVSQSFEQTDSGVKFRWEVAVAPLGQQVALEHVVPLDRSDIMNAQLNRQFVILHHEVQERIRGLADCATEGDLACALSEFQLEPEHKAVGDVCVICQEEMEVGEDALEINSCGHCFHSDCVRGWLLGCKHECPICKAPVETPSEPKPSQQLLPEGTEVVIDGLQNRADLNGTHGQIIGFREESGRYRVRTDNGCLSVLPKNVVSQSSVSTAQTQVVDLDDSIHQLDEEFRAAMEMSLDV
jgi:hypothetical protein